MEMTELPEKLPAQFRMLNLFRRNSSLFEFKPGMSGSYLHDYVTNTEIAFYVHAISDGGHLGQWMFVQIAQRQSNDKPFGRWHYGFYYRNSPSFGRDEWKLDLNFETQYPGHAAFGVYVEQHLGRKES